VLLTVVFLYIDLGELMRAVEDGQWGWLLPALALVMLATVPGAARWRLILQKAEIEVSGVQAVKTFAASLVLNNVLPTSVGGDAVRAWSVGKASGRLLRAALSTVLDRATAVACLFLLAWTALAVDADEVPAVLVSVLLWLTLGLAAVTAVAALVAAGIRPVVRRIPRRIAMMLREAWATLRMWGRSRSLISWLLVLGVLYQLLAVLALVLVGRVARVDLSFSLAAVTAAIVVVAMLVPISVGGLGVREGGFVLLLGEAGVDGSEAALISLLSAATIVLASAAVVAMVALYELVGRTGQRQSMPREPTP